MLHICGPSPPLQPRVVAGEMPSGKSQETNMGKLDGKVAVITGGNSGMGLATAKLFAHEGAAMVVTDRDQATLDTAVQSIGNGAAGIRSDISSMPDIEALRDVVGSKHGRVDVIFANAGGAKSNMFEYIT